MFLIYFILGCICECCKVTMYPLLKLKFDLKSDERVFSFHLGVALECQHLTRAVKDYDHSKNRIFNHN